LPAFVPETLCWAARAQARCEPGDIVKIGHRVRLVPTGEQETAFRRACGVSRFAYNWALSEWRLQSEAGETPSEIALRKRLNSMKAEQFPWMAEVSKNAPQQAIKNLGKAYANFFIDLKKYRGGEIDWKARARAEIQEKRPPRQLSRGQRAGQQASQCGAGQR
jgi:transposase